MSWRMFLLGLLAWLLLPTAVIGGAALYVQWQNGMPQQGPLTASVEPAVAFVDGRVVERISFDGTGFQTAQREPPLDIIFAIDVSASVQNTIGDLIAAVQTTVRGLSRAGNDAPRYALIAFSDHADTTLQWTSDEQRLATSLQGLVAGGGTRFDSTQGNVDDLLGQRRAGARTALIIYTDGDFQDWPDVLPYGEALRRRNVDLFVVGTPNTSLPAPVLDLVGDPQRVLETRNVQHLAYQFQQLKRQLISGVGFDARLRVPLDGRHFAIAGASPAWGSDGTDPIAFLGTLSQRRQDVELPLQPLSFGIWRIGTAVPRLTYADAGGVVREVLMPRRPTILVLSLLLLILAYLPVALWTLLYLWTRPRPEPLSRRPLPHVAVPSAPRVLPAPGGAQPPRSAPVPTLLIGLGGSGGRCLQALSRHVARRGETSESLQLSQLWLDVDRSAAEATDSVSVSAFPPVVTPPLAACRLETVVAGAEPLPPHLHWFPRQQYRDASRASLSVERGCSGDRRLGRLALFEWLARGDLQQLDAAVARLMQTAPANAPRQVLVFGAAAGGFGGGSVIDVCRIVRRAGQTAAGRTGTNPDIIPILLGSRATVDALRIANQKALLDELETARLTSAYPMHTAYRADDVAVTTSQDVGAPFNWVFWMAGDDDSDTIAQAATLGSVLTDAQPRAKILGDITVAEAPVILPCRVNGAYVRLNLLHDLVAAELFLRIIGPEVVADIEPSPAGGYQPKAVAPRRAEDLLRTWSEAEDVDGPWGRLLRHVAGRAVLPLSALEREEAPQLTLEWLREAASWSFNRLLDGRRLQTDAATRDLTTSEAAACLHLLARRIGETADDSAQRVVVEPNLLRAFADELAEAAHGLDSWLAAVCAAAAEAALTRQHATEEIREQGAGAIRYLDAEALASPSSLARWIEEALRRWLPDTEPVPTMREYLHLALLPGDQDIQVVFRACVGEVRDWRRPDDALSALRTIVRDVARGVGPADIGAVIRQLDEPQLQRVAALLRADRDTPWRSFVVVPRRAAGSEAALDPLLSRVTEKSGAGPRTDTQGDDRTGIARVVIAWRDESLNTETAGRQPLPYDQSPEVAAEQMRLRIESVFEKRVTQLPPLLRLALAHPDAFEAFAAAYRSGQLVRQADAAGVEQWFDTSSREFLTTTAKPTLAEAAARFTSRWEGPVGEPPSPQETAVGTGGEPDAALDEWKRTGRDPNGDALVVAAMACTSAAAP